MSGNQTKLPEIPAEEIADLFRRAIAHEVPMTLADPNLSWDDAYCGNVEFLIDGYRIVVFNDCDEFDYVDSVTAPDGRESDFDEWAPDDPAGLLSEMELGEIEVLASVAKFAAVPEHKEK